MFDPAPARALSLDQHLGELGIIPVGILRAARAVPSFMLMADGGARASSRCFYFGFSNVRDGIFFLCERSRASDKN